MADPDDHQNQGETPDDPQGQGETPDLEAILRMSQGITADMDTGIAALASIHARWRQAWRDTGTFTEEETFELVRVLVAASSGAIRSLGLSWQRSGTGTPGPGHEVAGVSVSRTTLTGPQGELVIDRDVIEVHYLSDIDAHWTYTDHAGHRHHCEYEAADRYPTLTEVTDETYWCETCQDEHQVTHLECCQCGEPVRPGTTGPGVKFIPGLITRTWNGEPVSQERAEQIIAEWQVSRG